MIETAIVYVVVSQKCSSCGYEFEVTCMEIYPINARMIQVRCPKCYAYTLLKLLRDACLAVDKW